MRPSFQQLSFDLKEEFKSYLIDDLDENDIQTIMTVEIVLTVFSEIGPDQKAVDAWAMIPGYDEIILPKVDLTKVKRLRVLFPHLRNQTPWEQLLEEYQNIPEKYRCYALHKDGEYFFQEPVCFKHRVQKYQEMLNQPFKHDPDRTDFVQPGKKFSYFDYVHNVRRSGEVPESPPIHLEKLCYIKEKKELDISPGFKWSGIAKEMDDKTSNKNGYWQKRVNFSLYPLTREKHFHYRGNQHIGGGLGAGKSTFMMVETYRLVTKHGAKVGFIESNVEQAIQRQLQFKQLGIEAVVITGTSNRQEHLHRFVSSREKDIVFLNEWTEDPYEYGALADLSGKCFIHALTEDFEQTDSYPCERLVQGQRKKLCPFISFCGVHRPFRQLNQAPVWIATTGSLLHTRIPKAIDPYNRLILEAMYDLLDVIFVDEADKVQQEFDQSFVTEIDLIGGRNHLYDILQAQSEQYIRSCYTPLKNNLVMSWQSHLDLLQNNINKIYNILLNSPALRRYLRREVFHLYRLLHDLAKKLASHHDDYTKSEAYKKLKEHIQSPLDESPFASHVDRLTRPNIHINRTIRQNVLHEVLKKMNVQLDLPPSKKQFLYCQLEFFLLLAAVDYCFRYLIHYYYAVRAQVGFDDQNHYFFRRMAPDFSPFIKDGMTGMMLGYRYIQDDDGSGTFKLIEYNGVGRLLLKDWSQLYEQTDAKKGPAIVFLSGTSFAPGSSHYELEEPIRWLLRGNQEPPDIVIFTKKIYDIDNDGEPIHISGLDTDQRPQQLQKLIGGLKQTIQDEIDHWSGVGRKILLVVNSYDDCEIIADQWRNDYQWKKCFKILTRSEPTEFYHYPRGLIERFPEEESEILVVPLMAIGRGYNILLPGTTTSLFGSAFFLIRPYPVPGDMQNMIQLLHAKLPFFLQDIKREGKQFADAMRELRNKSIRSLESMVRKPDFWYILTSREKRILSWYTFILIWQMIGRLLRRDTNKEGSDETDNSPQARIFFVDSKFYRRIITDDGDELESMMDYWLRIVRDHETDTVFKELYGPFAKALQKWSEVHALCRSNRNWSYTRLN